MYKKTVKSIGIVIALFILVFSNSYYSTKAAVSENRILFVSNRNGGVDSSDSNNEIYLMNPDGSNVIGLTNNSFYDSEPCWSPDGTQIAFTSMRDGNFEIYIMKVDGTSPNDLTNNPAYLDKEPSWGPKIAFTSNRTGIDEVYTINSDGTDLVQLTNNGGSQPTWSPDGKKICYISNGDIYVMNADGSDQTKLSNNFCQNSYPCWSPDGTKILYSANPDWDWEIFVMNADGSNLTNLTISSVEDDTHPVWSSDGTKIYFQSHRDGNWDLYQMNSNDGSMQTRITKRLGDSFSPRCYIAQINPNTWEIGPSLQVARYWHGVTETGGKIYAIYGKDINNLSLDSIEEYNPSTNNWTIVFNNSIKRSCVSATSLNGKIYIAGGGSSIEEYNPNDKTCTTVASISTRLAPAIAVGKNGTESNIYIFGGYYSGTLYNDIWEYNPATKLLTKKNATITARWAASAVSYGDKIYIIGGSNDSGNSVSLATVEIYDPVTDTITPGPALNTKRSTFGAVVLNDKIYAVGGYQNHVSLNTVEVLDPVYGNTWTTLSTTMPTPRVLSAAALNGKIYAVGGYNASASVLGNVEIYTP